MDNKELLLKMGFFERDGWLCNPKLDGQAVFKIDDPDFGCENETLAEMSSHMTAAAFNAGSRWQREDMKKMLAAKLRREADILEGIIVDEDDD